MRPDLRWLQTRCLPHQLHTVQLLPLCTSACERSGTGTQLTLYCIEETLDQDVDLVFEEFATNDGWVSCSMYIRGLEHTCLLLLDLRFAWLTRHGAYCQMKSSDTIQLLTTSTSMSPALLPICLPVRRYFDQIVDARTLSQERLLRKLLDFPNRPAVVIMSFLQVGCKGRPCTCLHSATHAIRKDRLRTVGVGQGLALRCARVADNSTGK